jgi:hypothetical protein
MPTSGHSALPAGIVQQNTPTSAARVLRRQASRIGASPAAGPDGFTRIGFLCLGGEPMHPAPPCPLLARRLCWIAFRSLGLAPAAHAQARHILTEKGGFALEADPPSDMPDHAGWIVVMVKYRLAPLAPVKVPRFGFSEPLPPPRHSLGQSCELAALAPTAAIFIGPGLWCQRCPRCGTCVRGSLCSGTYRIALGCGFGVGLAPCGQPCGLVGTCGHRCQTRLLPRCHVS